MDFGLWVEPEMVNPNSDLYRAHPDWVLNFTGRPRSEGRNQLMLNLARKDVRAYVFNFLDKLLTENDIAFLKWDYNRQWSEPGWPEVGPDSDIFRRPSTSSTSATSTASLPSSAPSTPKSKSSPAPPAAAASTSASSPTPTRSGPPTTPTPSTASASRTASPTPTPRRS